MDLWWSSCCEQVFRRKIFARSELFFAENVKAGVASKKLSLKTCSDVDVSDFDGTGFHFYDRRVESSATLPGPRPLARDFPANDASSKRS